MMLLVDAGNTRVKWRLVSGSEIRSEGASSLNESDPFQGIKGSADCIHAIEVSSVGSEQSCKVLVEALAAHSSAPIRFHWALSGFAGLTNSYNDVTRMGADRWHGMVAAWVQYRSGVAVVDAGSAVTVDYVNPDGLHIGGYILPGLGMMRRSLKLDAARIGFDADEQLNTAPGRSTGECVNHGLAWLTAAVITRIEQDAVRLGLGRVVLTGGDAPRFLDLGLKADYRPGLVFEGLELAAKGSAAT